MQKYRVSSTEKALRQMRTVLFKSVLYSAPAPAPPSRAVGYPATDLLGDLFCRSRSLLRRPGIRQEASLRSSFSGHPDAFAGVTAAKRPTGCPAGTIQHASAIQAGAETAMPAIVVYTRRKHEPFGLFMGNRSDIKRWAVFGKKPRRAEQAIRGRTVGLDRATPHRHVITTVKCRPCFS